MKRVLVIGGSGFLGSYISDELTNRSYKVIIADVKPSYYLKKGQDFFHCDILDEDSLDSIISEVDFVYNFAGLADINLCFDRPKDTFNLNIIGNVNVLNSCVKHKIKKFVYASSAYAISSKGSFYGISKFSSEKIVKEYYDRFGLNYTIIRYGSLYGARADEHNGLYRILKQALDNKLIVHKGDGEEVREYIHAFDAAKLSVNILENKDFDNKNIILTGFEKIKQKDLLIMIKEIFNDEINIEYLTQNYKGHYEVTPYSFTPDLAQKLVANPFIDLGQGILSCIDAMKDNK